MPGVRDDGAGKITQRKDGRYVATMQIGGVRRSVYGRTEKEVRARLGALRRAAAQDGALAEAGRHTLTALAEAWLASAPDLRATTIASYRSLLEAYVLPALGKEPLERITPDRLQRLYATLRPSVAEKLHRILHRAFAIAVLWRWLGHNPCDRVLRPAYRVSERRLWSSAQAQTFLTGVERHRFGPLFVLLLATGLRIGEALALRWEDVGLGVAITVKGTLKHVQGAPQINEPKTASGRRTVLLPPVAIAALQRQKAQQEQWRERSAGWAGGGDDWFVFTSRTGRALHPATIQHAMHRLCGTLGLPRLTPHGLRHLHASLLIQEGVPITAVSARLGHANSQITLRLYAHALPGQDVLAAEAIQRAMAITPAPEAGRWPP